MKNRKIMKKPEILIVDDDNGILELLKDVLQHKFNIITTDSSEEALREMTNHDFDAMIIDIFLPVMTGVDILRYVKNHYPKSIVIMMSGSPTLDLAVKLTKLGAWDVLPKPLDMRKLEEQISNALSNDSMAREFPFEINLIRDIPPEFKIHRILTSNDHSMIIKVERDSIIYAMKILKYEGYDENYRKKIRRFFREAEIMMQISHPNIVKIFESKFADGKVPYILMEYLPDSSLSTEKLILMPWETKINMVCKLADALNVVHKAGILHRDIKPSNVMIAPDGEPRLSDFGISGLQNSSLTMTSEVVGSPKFMAPEAFVSLKKTDARSDIFSFGILTYIILTGQHPFDGDSLEEIIQSVSIQKPVRPSLLNPDISDALNDVLSCMLAKYQSQRYRTMEEVLNDLNACKENKSSPKKTFISSMFKHFHHFAAKNNWSKESTTRHK